ncbi:MAG: sugar transferase [Maritimibacter sp.]
MPFDQSLDAVQLQHGPRKAVSTRGGSWVFWICKRLFDISLSLVLLVVTALLSVALLALNPFFNRGPLFFVQDRMGRNCEPFRAIKFRSMTAIPLDEKTDTRGAADPLETGRITPLGKILRKSRIDELPQVINVLRGDMSLIGPRPDALEHATEYLREIASYRDRHQVRPGISGLAQVTLGYAMGYPQTRAKSSVDMIYIREAGFGMEARVFWLTLVTVFLRRGA